MLIYLLQFLLTFAKIFDLFLQKILLKKVNILFLNNHKIL
jgi:hypothetical protein